MNDELKVCVPACGKPDLCQECGQEFLTLVAEKAGQLKFAFHWCSHNATVALARVAADDDGRGCILWWSFEGPVDYERAAEIAKQVEAETGATMVLNHGGMVQ